MILDGVYAPVCKNCYPIADFGLQQLLPFRFEKTSREWSLMVRIHRFVRTTTQSSVSRNHFRFSLTKPIWNDLRWCVCTSLWELLPNGWLRCPETTFVSVWENRHGMIFGSASTPVYSNYFPKADFGLLKLLLFQFEKTGREWSSMVCTHQFVRTTQRLTSATWISNGACKAI